MKKEELDYLLKTNELEEKGIDAWADAYLFDPQFAKSRNERVVHDGRWPFYRTRLSILLREGMSDERRARICASSFDLGSALEMAPAEQSRVSLLLNIRGIDGETMLDGERDAYKPRDVFGTIYDRIKQFTGLSISDFEEINKVTALRVVKLLHQMQTRNSRLMQHLSMPAHNLDQPRNKRKFSLALRAGRDHEKLGALNFLFGDLKAWLSIELSDKFFFRLETISAKALSFFNQFIWKLRDDLEKKNVPLNQQPEVYKELAFRIYEVPFLIEDKDLPFATRLKLDEKLYFYLHELEIAHLVVGYPQLVIQAIPQVVIAASVIVDLEQLLARLFPGTSKLTALLVTLEDVPDFLTSIQADVVAILQKAFELEISANVYKKHAENAQRLLRDYYVARGGNVNQLNVEITKTNLLMCISAVATVYYTASQTEGEWAPFLPGHTSNSEIAHSKKKDMPNESTGASKMAEEHILILQTRLEAFSALLEDDDIGFISLLGLKAEVLDWIWTLYASHDIDCLEKGIETIGEYFARYLPAVAEHVNLQSK